MQTIFQSSPYCSRFNLSECKFRAALKKKKKKNSGVLANESYQGFHFVGVFVVCWLELLRSEKSLERTDENPGHDFVFYTVIFQPI